jgi:hypothetical protein
MAVLDVDSSPTLTGAGGIHADIVDAESIVLGIVRMVSSTLVQLQRSPNPAAINVCSIAATAGLPELAMHSASKEAVLSPITAMDAGPVAARAALEARQLTGRPRDRRQGRRCRALPRIPRRLDDRHGTCCGRWDFVTTPPPDSHQHLGGNRSTST